MMRPPVDGMTTDRLSTSQAVRGFPSWSINAARALIGWKQSDLAAASGVAEISVKNIERGATDPRSSTLAAIQKAFLNAGVTFLDPGDVRNGGHGVRLL